MSKVKFYVATLAAAVERAARIAPNKGVAYDKAAGIMLTVDPATETAALYATDLEVMYREEIRDVVDYGEEPVTWRLPSNLFSGIISGLPLDKEVTIKDDGDRRIRIFCGRKQAKLKTMPHDIYPTWERVDRSALKPVPGFSHRVAQVAWATDKDNVPLTGVNIDGTHLNATDRYKMARVPCEVPIDKPVTVAMSVLSPILKNLPGEVSLAATDDYLLMTVGEEIEATCVLFAKEYPDLGKLIANRGEYGFHVKVNREALYDSINGMLVLVKNERYPRMHFEFDEGVISMFMTVADVGDMNDELEAEFEVDSPYRIDYNPEFLLKSLEAATGNHVIWSLGPRERQVARIQDGDYVAMVMPLAPVSEKKDDK